MSLYIPKMSDTPGVTIPGLASNFNALADSRIVEYGSNENGQYWRWENGLQVCLKVETLRNVAFSADGVIFMSESQTWNLPATFSSASYFAYGNASGSARRFWVHRVSQTNTLFSYVILSPTSGTIGNTSVALFAIGRWK